MNSVKPWFLSKTIWASAVTFAISIAGLLGLSTDTIDQQSLVDILMQFATALAGLVAIVGRFNADSRIS
ncbi:hypothetical protein C5748_01260 [Phyllobacterium phragmitis]|uniref:Holin n=1 Tax=Phyllobacterium phragmitis TaxID=2670329 RepID=A0A2S9IZ54_9HYPH|nr:hypothetical protein [Phyllobacterium phragmitis]PRD45807.1 hypothetical protein C5748_01260 [Phyllobacterium phragmitis]